MCGIAGFVGSNAIGKDAAIRQATAMTRPLAHRGPDGEGIWAADDGVVGFGHRRLAIIDLSPTGFQPMASGDGRWVVTYNGETYNFQDLRCELESLGVVFRGTSDTEVIVEGFARWGVEATARKLNGIFALAAWDRRDRTLWLVRDHFGIKPLYYVRAGGGLAFGSELKALRAVPSWKPRIDRDALGSYFQFSYIPAPHTIYEGVHKLHPGGILQMAWGQEPKVWRYWDAFAVAGRGAAQRGEMDDEEAVDRLDALLRDSVRRQMISDVPLGALLSGGIDSSTVVALMQAQSSRQVRTYSIGFHAEEFNEAPYAAAVAKHLGTAHEELHADEDMALGVIPRLSEMYDEPFADSSQIPTYLVSCLARRHVTVALSGDGGDELFAGYPRYGRHPNVWNRTRKIPLLLRRGMSSAMRSIDLDGWTAIMERMPRSLRGAGGGANVLRLAAAIRQDDARDFHRSMISFWHEVNDIVPRAGAVETAFDRPLPAGLDYQDVMQLLDSSTYMIDDVLVKVDRASMATALEVRVPILDPRVYEFSWTLPARMKLRGDAQKWILRNVLYRYVPRELIDRPKAGFAVPLAQWMRGELRDWCEALLDERRLRQDGLVDAACVRKLWDEHRAGTYDHSERLWAVLQLQSWLDTAALPAGGPPARDRVLADA